MTVEKNYTSEELEVGDLVTSIYSWGKNYHPSEVVQINPIRVNWKDKINDKIYCTQQHVKDNLILVEKRMDKEIREVKEQIERAQKELSEAQTKLGRLELEKQKKSEIPNEVGMFLVKKKCVSIWCVNNKMDTGILFNAGTNSNVFFLSKGGSLEFVTSSHAKDGKMEFLNKEYTLVRCLEKKEVEEFLSKTCLFQ